MQCREVRVSADSSLRHAMLRGMEKGQQRLAVASVTHHPDHPILSLTGACRWRRNGIAAAPTSRR